MIPIHDAQRRLLEWIPRLPPVVVGLDEALGRVCTGYVISGQAVPPFANSSVDGYAVRRADLVSFGVDPTDGSGVPLRVLGTVNAGSVAPTPVVPGTTWKVMTGAPLPEGADTVVMVELSSATADDRLDQPGDKVHLYAAPPRGTGVRAAGSDVTPGDVVVPAGTVLHPPWLAVLSGIGISQVEVSPVLRVAVLVTGDELVRGGGDLGPGQIHDANTPMIMGLLREAGCEPVDLGIGSDDPAEVAATLAEAARRYDAIVTSGGVSMGDADPVKLALQRLGELNWLQVAMRPAKPFAWGLLPGRGKRSVPVFGLPGNPVSSLVSFEVLVRPALRAMAGHVELHRPRINAVVDEPMVAVGGDGRTNLVRVAAEWGPDGMLHVRPVAGGQESHQISASARADGLAEVPPGVRLEPGDAVVVRLLRG